MSLRSLPSEMGKVLRLTEHGQLQFALPSSRQSRRLSRTGLNWPLKLFEDAQRLGISIEALLDRRASRRKYRGHDWWVHRDRNSVRRSDARAARFAEAAGSSEGSAGESNKDGGFKPYG